MATVHDILGDWASDDAQISALAAHWSENGPFPHAVIDGFLRSEVAEELCREFPDPPVKPDGWCVYDNPIERKFANNKRSTFPPAIARVFEMLQTEEFVGLMCRISGIDNLENDPLLHGAGMHFSPDGGKLDVHLDYSVHPFLPKERRVNLILYLNKEWKAEWGGELELRAPAEGEEGQDQQPGEIGAKVFCGFNRAALFRTSDLSFHGFPDAIQCPEGEARRSLAMYYVTDIRPDANPREKARFYANPDKENPRDVGLEALRRIRVQRILSEEDVREHAPWFDSEWKAHAAFREAQEKSRSGGQD